jgi:hypothetical protein
LEHALDKRDAGFVEEFVKFLKDYLSDKERLRSALMFFSGTKSDVASTTTATGLARLLLLVNRVQTSLFEFLLEKAVELGDESPRGGINWVQLILSRFCFLPQLINSEQVCDRLLDLLEVQPVSIIKLVIVNIVAIVSDVHHDRFAERLM